MTRLGCPFCGHIHVNVGTSGSGGRKAYVECRRCKARGPQVEQVAASGEEWQAELTNDAVARWDRREPA